MTTIDAKLPGWLRGVQMFLAGVAFGLFFGICLPLWWEGDLGRRSWLFAIPALCILAVLPGYALEVVVRLRRITAVLGSPPAPQERPSATDR